MGYSEKYTTHLVRCHVTPAKDLPAFFVPFIVRREDDEAKVLAKCQKAADQLAGGKSTLRILSKVRFGWRGANPHVI